MNITNPEMMITYDDTTGRFVFFEIRSYPTEDFSNRPNPSSKILTSGDGAISLPEFFQADFCPKSWADFLHLWEPELFKT